MFYNNIHVRVSVIPGECTRHHGDVDHTLSKQGWVGLLLSSINIYGHVIIMIHLAHDAADQHQQAHNNSHQALQNSEACSLLLFLGSDWVQLEGVPGVSVQTFNIKGKNQTEELVRGWQQCKNNALLQFSHLKPALYGSKIVFSPTFEKMCKNFTFNSVQQPLCTLLSPKRYCYSKVLI